MVIPTSSEADQSHLTSTTVHEPGHMKSDNTSGLQLLAGTNFSDFCNSLIWWVLILVDLQSQLPGLLNFV